MSLGPEIAPNTKVTLDQQQYDAALRARQEALEAGGTGVVNLPGRKGGNFVADFSAPADQATARIEEQHFPDFRTFQGTTADGSREVRVHLTRRNVVARAISSLLGKSRPYRAEIFYQDDPRPKIFGGPSI